MGYEDIWTTPFHRYRVWSTFCPYLLDFVKENYQKQLKNERCSASSLEPLIRSRKNPSEFVGYKDIWTTPFEFWLSNRHHLPRIEDFRSWVQLKIRKWHLDLILFQWIECKWRPNLVERCWSSPELNRQTIKMTENDWDGSRTTRNTMKPLESKSVSGQDLQTTGFILAKLHLSAIDQLLSGSGGF